MSVNSRRPRSDRTVDFSTFAGLLNTGVIVSGQDARYTSVDRHFFLQLMRGLITQVYVDEVWYKNKYQDVSDALEQGTLRSARQHYIEFGFYEHRMPYEIVPDEQWYLDNYPDVRAAVRREDYSSAQEHFDLVGYAEGRLPFANFALLRG